MKPPTTWAGVGLLFWGMELLARGRVPCFCHVTKEHRFSCHRANAIIPPLLQEANLGQLKLGYILQDPPRLTGEPAFCVIQTQEGATLPGNMLSLLQESKLTLGVEGASEPCSLEGQLLTSFHVSSA